MDVAAAMSLRAFAARVNSLGVDRIGVRFATICTMCIYSWMASSTVGAMSRLRRVVRYVAEAKSIVWEMNFAPNDELWIDAFAKSDWPARANTRKSTSEDLLSIMGVVVKTWSVLQKSVAA